MKAACSSGRTAGAFLKNEHVPGVSLPLMETDTRTEVRGVRSCKGQTFGNG
jgi:hypothetical protein